MSFFKNVKIRSNVTWHLIFWTQLKLCYKHRFLSCCTYEIEHHKILNTKYQSENVFNWVLKSSLLF